MFLSVNIYRGRLDGRGRLAPRERRAKTHTCHLWLGRLAHEESAVSQDCLVLPDKKETRVCLDRWEILDLPATRAILDPLEQMAYPAEMDSPVHLASKARREKDKRETLDQLETWDRKGQKVCRVKKENGETQPNVHKPRL